MRSWIVLVIAAMGCGDSEGDVDAMVGSDTSPPPDSTTGDGDAARTYTVSGTVSGLVGSGLELSLNGDEVLAITADGPFAFTTLLADGEDFRVEVGTQPSGPNQTCSVTTAAMGTIISADVDVVEVTCETNRYAIGGSISGLEGSGLVLQNDLADDLSVTTDGAFAFDEMVEDGGSYAVTVAMHPSSPNQMCTVNDGMGTVSGADVTDVSVVCSTDTHTISGTATGVTSDVVLTNNGGDPITLSADGPFTFPMPIADGAMYRVEVMDTTGQYCVVSGGTGTVSGVDVTTVTLDCGPVPTTVAPLYPTNGADWNDYVLGTADVSCVSGLSVTSRYGDCTHGGEARSVEVLGKSSCTDLTITESLGLFEWECDDSVVPVRMVSRGLRDGVKLSDLLDFSAGTWRPNSVTVSDAGVEHFTTASEAWWANPIVVDNDGGDLDATGTIYLVTSPALTPATGGYVIAADSVALVSQPGVVIAGPGIGAGSSVVSSTAGTRHLWIEVSIDGSADETGLDLGGTWTSVLEHTTVTGAMASFVSLGASLSLFASRVRDLTIRDTETSGLQVFGERTEYTRIRSENHAGVCMGLAGAAHRFTEVVAENCDSTGISVGGEDLLLSEVSSHHNGGTGIDVHWADGTLHSAAVSNNASHGLRIDSADAGVYAHLTATNNAGSGVRIADAQRQILRNVTASGNGRMGVELLTAATGTSLLSAVVANNAIHGLETTALRTTVVGVAAVDNAQGGIRIVSDDNRFSGHLIVGTNGAYDCWVTSGAMAPGLDDDIDPSDMGDDTVHDGLCIEQGASDFGTAITLASAASAFVSRVYVDGANASATGVPVAFPANPDAFDWSTFDHRLRSWGPDSAYGLDSRVAWTTGDGAIWDWSLTTADTVLANRIAPADAGIVYTHMRSTSAITFLANALEIVGDGIGNDDALCQSDETCLFTPNLGAYQGHGTIVDLVVLPTVGPLTNITVRNHATNGR